MEIYLIRHTTPVLSAGLIYGRTEVDLMDSFPAEVDAIRSRLPARFDAVYSSPSRRCTQLAEQLAPGFQTDDRLREFHFGDWEGKTWDTIDPDASKAWMEDFVHVSTPNGESMLQMSERVTDFWTDLRRQSHQNVGIITHGGVIRLLVAADRHLPLTAIFTVNVAYGEVIRLQSR